MRRAIDETRTPSWMQAVLPPRGAIMAIAWAIAIATALVARSAEPEAAGTGTGSSALVQH